MSANIGGNEVKAGFFWNTRTWEMTVLSGKGGKLPGGAEDRYIRIPMLAMLLLGPVMGALFVMFLPLVGFWLLFRHLAIRGYELTRNLLHGTTAAARMHTPKSATPNGAAPSDPDERS